MIISILQELVTVKFLLLYVYLASVLFLHFRGRERKPFGKQLIDHSGLMAPYNALMYLFSGVPRDPILDARKFPELDVVRANWQTIRDEALALLTQGRLRGPGTDDLVFLAFNKRGWKRFHLRWYEDFLPSARETCPKTIEILSRIPSLNAAAFTLLPPGGQLGKHRDPLAASLRYHIGLVCPKVEGCRLWVDGVEHTWRDGEDIVFDETYVHWARNDTEESRIILFCDITRPLHTPVMRAFNRFFIRHVFHITRSRNEATERFGLLNWFTSYIYRYKYWLKARKKQNRFLYYTAKHAFVLAMVYLVFLRGLAS